MRIGGEDVTRRGQLDPLVFERDNGQLIAFIIKPVYDLDEFEALCPEPDPSKFGALTPKGWAPDPEAPELLDLRRLYNKRRWAYLVIKSLEPSNIEWEKVKLSDPQTWQFWEEELRAVLSYTEYGVLMRLIDQANTLDAGKLEENRQTFFQRRRALLDSLTTGQNGEVAKP